MRTETEIKEKLAALNREIQAAYDKNETESVKLLSMFEAGIDWCIRNNAPSFVTERGNRL